MSAGTILQGQQVNCRRRATARAWLALCLFFFFPERDSGMESLLLMNSRYQKVLNGLEQKGSLPFVGENTLQPHASSPALFYSAHSSTDPQARALEEGARAQDTPSMFSEPTPL